MQPAQCWSVGADQPTGRAVRKFAAVVLDEVGRHLRSLIGIVERRHEVLQSRAARLPLHESHLAQHLDAADLHLLHVRLNQHFLFRDVYRGLVVPDLDFHAAIERAAFGRGIRCNRLRVAGPLVRNRIGPQQKRLLQVLGHLAGALPRQPRVIAERLHKCARESLVIRMADEMQPDVVSVTQLVERLAQQFDVFVRDARDAGVEPSRRR